MGRRAPVVSAVRLPAVVKVIQDVFNPYAPGRPVWTLKGPLSHLWDLAVPPTFYSDFQ